MLLTASLDGGIGAWERGGERCLGRLRLDQSPPGATGGVGGGAAGGGIARAGEGGGGAGGGGTCGWAVPLQTAPFHNRRELERALFERRLDEYRCAATLPPKAEGEPEHLLEVCGQTLADLEADQADSRARVRPNGRRNGGSFSDFLK